MSEFISNRFFLPYEATRVATSLNIEGVPNLTLALKHFLNDMTFLSEVDAVAFVCWQMKGDKRNQLSCYPFLDFNKINEAAKLPVIKNIIESFNPVIQAAEQNGEVATIMPLNLAFRNPLKEIQKFIENPCQVDKILSGNASARLYLIAITA